MAGQIGLHQRRIGFVRPGIGRAGNLERHEIGRRCDRKDGGVIQRHPPFLTPRQHEAQRHRMEDVPAVARHRIATAEREASGDGYRARLKQRCAREGRAGARGNEMAGNAYSLGMRPPPARMKAGILFQRIGDRTAADPVRAQPPAGPGKGEGRCTRYAGDKRQRWRRAVTQNRRGHLGNSRSDLSGHIAYSTIGPVADTTFVCVAFDARR
jgi:hypothetical protein